MCIFYCTAAAAACGVADVAAEDDDADVALLLAKDTSPVMETLRTPFSALLVDALLSLFTRRPPLLLDTFS